MATRLWFPGKRKIDNPGIPDRESRNFKYESQNKSFMQLNFYRVLFLLSVSLISFFPFEGFSKEKPNGLETIMVSMRFENITLKETLTRIRQQVHVSFAYNEKDVNVGIRVSGNFNNTPLPKVLDQLLIANGYVYKEQNRMILVSPAPKPEKPVPKGGVKGKVYDAVTGETLVGASIVVEGTNKGTTTDREGQYTLSGLEPGTWHIAVSFVSYQKKLFTDVRVASGNNTLLDVPLNPATENISEVEVVGRVNVKTAPIRNTDEISLIHNIRTSDLMVTGISSEQIGKSLDRDASDVVKRAPGVSMLNNFVMIRGMSPRYTKTYINGMQMSSSESFQRAFAFDLIPSGVIDAIDIYRMPAPELPGGFGGGIIKVKTKKSQTARRFQISVSGDYDTDNSFTDLYTGSNDSDKDWMGMGGDDREFLPQLDNLPSYNLYPAERLDQLKTMKPVNDLEKSRHSLNRSFGINYYDSWLIGRVRINNLTSLNYTYKREAHTNYRFYYSDIITSGHKEEQLRDGIERLDSISAEKVRLNALQSLNVVFNNNHQVSFEFFANRNATDANSMSHRATEFSVSSRLSDAIPKDIQTQYSYKINDLFSGQFSGTHRFGKHELEWSYGRSKFKSFVPNQEIFDFQYLNPSQNEGFYRFNFSSIAGTGDNSRSSYAIEEEGENAALNYTFTLNQNSKMKAGGAYIKQNRTSVSSDYYWITHYNSGGNAYYIDDPNPWLHLSEILGPDLYDVNAVSPKDFEEVVTDNNYRYDNKIWAGFLAWKQSFFRQKLELYGGMRYEYEYAQLFDKNGDAVTEERIYIAGQSEPVILDLEGPYTNYWLPSISLTWNLNEKQKLRAGYGKTLDRVFARERSLDQYQSIEDGKLYTGNKVLKNASLDNADLRWEYYPSESEFLSAGLFYKHIQNPIENFEWEGAKVTNVVAVNYKEADLYGAEAEIRKNMGFIPVSWADRFSLIANVSYTYTRIRDSFFWKGSLEWTDEVAGNRPLTGTTPFLVNANLYYTDPKLKTQLAVNYNYTSETLYAAGDTEFGYLYQDPYDQLDVTLIQPFGKSVTLKAGVQNLFKKNITGWRDRDFDGEKRPDVESSFGQVPVSDIGDAMRISTFRKIYVGLTVSF